MEGYEDFLLDNINIMSHDFKPENAKEFLDLEPVIVKEAVNDEFWANVDASKPNDIIRLSYSEGRKIVDYWLQFDNVVKNDMVFSKDNLPLNFAPSDLIFADTIPLPDVIIETQIFDTDEYGKYRVVIFSKSIPLDDKPHAVGALVWSLPNGVEVGFPLIVKTNSSQLEFSDVMCYRGMNLRPTKNDALAINAIVYFTITAIWYGIQLALLNPVTKDLFSKNGKEKIKDMVKVGKKYKKGPTRYIKRIKIDVDLLDKEMEATTEDGKKTFIRHTLAWRVIGHWRHYKDGRVVFIKPYWKGTMKAIKEVNERKREIVLKGETNEFCRQN